MYPAVVLYTYPVTLKMGNVEVDANLELSVIVKVDPSVEPGATYVPKDAGKVETLPLKLKLVVAFGTLITPTKLPNGPVGP